MQNIGIVFVKMGQYTDAITSFEHIMSEAPSFKTGFNLILCYFALGDREKMKNAFRKLLTVDLKIDDEDKYLPHGVSSVPICTSKHQKDSRTAYLSPKLEMCKPNWLRSNPSLANTCNIILGSFCSHCI